MTNEQKAAFVIANSVHVLGELLGMHHLNVHRQSRGETNAYTDEQFCGVADAHGLGWNDLLEFLREEG